MRTCAPIFMLLFLVAFATAQDKGKDDKAKAPTTAEYANAELGVKFAGVYGWDSSFAKGSGAWTELARYKDAAYDADVVLLVRNNPYGGIDELRTAIEAEYKAGGEPQAGTPTYKEIELRDAAMKKGLKLPAIEAQGYSVTINAEGKKREKLLLVRTYLGKNRLFRIACSARRARAKRVLDLFQRAVAALDVEAEAERVASGQPFRSARGRWSCIVPAGFLVVLPEARSKTDMRFEQSRGGVFIAVYAYAYDRDLADHRFDLEEYYGESLTFEKEETNVLGGEGFIAKLKRKGQVTMIAGRVHNDAVYRVHVSAKEGKEADVRRHFAKFIKSMRIAR